MIKKGCAMAAVVVLGVFGAYLYLLWGKVEAVPAIILAGFGALGLLMVVGQLKAVLFGSGDVGALKRAEQGLPLEDGKEEAVWGRIEPLGAALVAPFSGRPCVAYEYDAKKASAPDDENATASTLAGFALAPSVIRSSRGDARLLGFSLLTEFPETVVDDPEAVHRAVRHAASSQPEEMGLAKLGAMISAMDDAMADDDGSVRKDMKAKDASVADLEACVLTEKVVAPGDTVTAIGIWDASRGGLVPSHRGKSAVVRLLPGGGAAMVAHGQKRPWGLLIFSLLWAAFAHVFIWLAWRGGFD